jgi:hypothetical protein
MLRASRKAKKRSEKACFSCITRIISILVIFRAMQLVMAVAAARRNPATAVIDSSPIKSPVERSVRVASLPAVETTVTLARPL